MRTIIAVLVLIFSLQSFTKADDISNFEIEGMSVGDSLLDYFSEKEIKKNLVTYYKDNTFSTTDITSSKFTTYDIVGLSYRTKDKNYKIVNIASFLILNKNDCANKMFEINEELIKIFKNYKIRKESKKHPIDKSGKSIVTSIYYDFDNEDGAALQCYDMSKETGYSSGLKIQISKKEMIDWLSEKAYE